MKIRSWIRHSLRDIIAIASFLIIEVFTVEPLSLTGWCKCQTDLKQPNYQEDAGSLWIQCHGVTINPNPFCTGKPILVYLPWLSWILPPGLPIRFIFSLFSTGSGFRLLLFWYDFRKQLRWLKWRLDIRGLCLFLIQIRQRIYGRQGYKIDNRNWSDIGKEDGNEESTGCAGRLRASKSGRASASCW